MTALTERRAELLARVLASCAALLPYWPLLAFDTLVVTDDGFTSDLWNGELPGRLLASTGATWTSALCSGTPIVSVDPASSALFRLLSPAAALDVLLLAWLLVAAHGSFALARRFGASRAGAVLAANAFAASGYLVTQLKHLAIVGTVVWLPLALLCLDHALGPGTAARPETPGRRLGWLALFGCVFGAQALQGFPQSAYACGLLYAAYALASVLSRDAGASSPQRSRLWWLAPAALVAVLAGVAGAATLLPLWELAQVSDRAAGGSLAWSVQYAYEPRNVLTFLLPYAYGDASDGSYTGASVFWEDYGYVGLVTFLLALYGCVRERGNRHVRFMATAALLSYLLVLGPATPIFGAAHALIPGFGLFRMPTRLLVITDFALCMLAALGLTRLTRDVAAAQAAAPGAARSAQLLAYGLCAVTALDLAFHQTRQNAFVDAQSWLAPPDVALALRAEPGVPRVFTPFHMDHHRAVYGSTAGWSDTRPYQLLRELLQPNANSYWGIASADCYAGVSASWHVDVWGDHSRISELVYRTIQPSPSALRLDASPAFAKLMRAYGVTHVIAPFAIPALEPALRYRHGSAHDTRIYRIAGAARARVVGRATRAPNRDEAVARLLDPSFDPEREVVLSDAPASVARDHAGGAGLARVTRDAGSELAIEVQAQAPAYLVLADTFFPGWTATVDGESAPIFRANLSVRAVPVPAGTHRVEMHYRSPAQATGRALSAGAWLALLALLALAAGCMRLAREARRP